MINIIITTIRFSTRGVGTFSGFRSGPNGDSGVVFGVCDTVGGFVIGLSVDVVVDLVVVLDRVVVNVIGTFVAVPTVVVIALPNSEFSKSIFVVIGFCVTGKGAAAGLAIQNGIVVFGLAGISVIL